uniref:Uncharacterized protein n=1 Tax=Cannabis sativa TaxID=3483 RepID=A0A803PPU4_CANSA
MNLISCLSSKQKVISRSNTECDESEYLELANRASKVSWPESLLRELNISPLGAPTMHCDDTSNLHLASNPILHAWTGHVEIDYHFIRERVNYGILSLSFTPSSD